MVVGRTSATPDDGSAWNVLNMQIAINGHLSQSTGADLSGQHGMSSDMETISIDAVGAAFAGAENGAITSPTIKKTASSRQRWIERFILAIFHKRATMETWVPSRNRQLP
jgi:hypothetical protein